MQMQPVRYRNTRKQDMIFKNKIKFLTRKTNDSREGFTLIELLVVITIIGILATLAAFGTERSFKSARDTQRKSDVDQYKIALETYANSHNGLYPAQAAAPGVYTNTAAFCVTNLGYAVPADCPTDPLSIKDTSWNSYKYKSDATGTQYVLVAKLEVYTAVGTDSTYIVCSNGKSGVTSNTNFSTPPIPCPL